MLVAAKGVLTNMNVRPGPALLSLALVLTAPAVWSQTQPTSTVLSVTPSSAPQGSVISLEALVTVGGRNGSAGTVQFLDGIRVLGTAQVTSSGTATLKTWSFAPGLHSVTARFQGTPGSAQPAKASSSSAQALNITGTTPTTTTISSLANGSSNPATYDLSAAVSCANCTSPTGTAQLSDLTANAIVASAPLPFAMLESQLGSLISRPEASFIATADFNGDGVPDVVLARGISVGVSLGNPSQPGTFEPEVSYGAFSAASAIAVGDMNNDGYMDFVVADSTGQAIYVFLSDPQHPGQFLAPVSYPVPDGPGAIAIGDLNGDGFLDVATSNISANTVTVWLADPAHPGNLLTRETYLLTGALGTIAFGDFNNDGLFDIAVATNSSGITLLLSDTAAPGQFLPQTPISIPQLSTFVIADFNGDNIPDLAVSGGFGLGLLVGDPAHPGQFLPVESVWTGLARAPLLATDLNGDGIPDLAFLSGIFAFLGDPANPGKFLPTTSQGLSSTLNYLSAADMYGTGTNQLLAVGTEGLTIINNQLTSTVVLTPSTIPSGGVHALSVSYSGSATTTSSSSSQVAINSLAIPAGQPSTTVLTLAANNTSLGQVVHLAANVSVKGTPVQSGSVTFLDGTRVLGIAQIIASGPSAGSASLLTASFAPGAHTLTANYSGAPAISPFAAASSSMGASLTVTAPENLSPATLASLVVQQDAANPGALDLTASVSGLQPTGSVNFAESSTGIALGSASLAPAKGETFTAGASIPLRSPFAGLPAGFASDAMSFAIADVNRDGVLDFVVLYDDNSIDIIEGDPANPGQFLPAQTIQVLANNPSGANGYSQVLVADLNRDGVPDLLAWNGYNSISVALGDSGHPGQFLTAQNYPYAALGGTQLRLADINGDGILDVLVDGSPIFTGDPNHPGAFVEVPSSPLLLFSSPQAVIGAAINPLSGNLLGDGSTYSVSASGSFVRYGIGRITYGPTQLNVNFGHGTQAFTLPPGGAVTLTGDFIGMGSLDIAVLSQGFQSIESGSGSPSINIFRGQSVSTASLVNFAIQPWAQGFTAHYSGDSLNSPSTATASVPAPSQSMTFTASQTVAEAGAPVTFTVSVAPAAAAYPGQVSFADGDTTLGTSALGQDGTASLTTTALAPGLHSIQAVVSGNGVSLTDSLGVSIFGSSNLSLLQISPGVIVQNGGGLGTATLYWNAPGKSHLEIHVGSPTGTLFAAGGPTGQSTTGNWVTDGMTFFLQDVSNGQALTSANTLAIASVHVQPPATGGSTIFSATANPILVQPGAITGTALLSWNAPVNVSQTEIRLSSPTGELFAGGDRIGYAATGDWVTSGMTFFLQDVSNGQPSPSNTLGQITLSLQQAQPTSGAATTQFTASPNPITQTTIYDGQFVGVMNFQWNAPPTVRQVEIHLLTPDGLLFAGGAGNGSALTGEWVYDGITFFLQDVTGGKPLTLANTLGVVVAHVARPTQFSANPNPITQSTIVKGILVGQTTLSWSATNVGSVDVRVGAPNGTLFASGGSTGTAQTGLWVSDGMTFYLQDTTGGRPLTAANTLATVVVNVH